MRTSHVGVPGTVSAVRTSIGSRITRAGGNVPSASWYDRVARATRLRLFWQPATAAAPHAAPARRARLAVTLLEDRVVPDGRPL